MQGSNFPNADLPRRLANIIRIGTVAEADYQKARVRVAFGTAVSDWLPWITFRAGGDLTWWAPEVNEQVVVMSPSGEISGGVVLGSIFSTAHPAPADRPTIARVVFEDGATFEYDRENHILHAFIPGFEEREIDQDMTVQVHRDVFRQVDRDVFNDIGGNRTDAIGGNDLADVGGDVQRTVGGKIILDAQGEVVINSATRVTFSAPQLVFDGPITHGNSTHGGGAEFYGPINQHNGDFVSDGVSVQHHTHPETGTETEEPVGGAS